MTKAEALKWFKEDIKPVIEATCGKGDKIAMREAWFNFVDSLLKDGQVTQKQADNWVSPW